MIKYVIFLTAAAGFRLAPTPRRAVHVLRAADYADAIEQDRVTLRRAAATKNEESDAVVDALLGQEQSCKERSRAEGASARRGAPPRGACARGPRIRCTRAGQLGQLGPLGRWRCGWRRCGRFAKLVSRHRGSE